MIISESACYPVRKRALDIIPDVKLLIFKKIYRTTHGIVLLTKMKFPKRLHYVKPPPDESWSFLENLDWFSSIGEDSDLSFEAAVSMAESNEWKDFTLERRNDITAHLATKHRNRETEWNKVVVGYRNYCDEKVFPLLIEAAEKNGFGETAVQSVIWNTISYMMEETYASWGVPRFFNKIIESHKKGKLPCGWYGDYPSGYLIKF